MLINSIRYGKMIEPLVITDVSKQIGQILSLLMKANM